MTEHFFPHPVLSVDMNIALIIFEIGLTIMKQCAGHSGNENI